MFPSSKTQVFENGIDSTFRSTGGKEVYIFKDNKYVRIDYDSKQLVGTIRNIGDGFPILKNTIFESGIDACFASHEESKLTFSKEISMHASNSVQNLQKEANPSQPYQHRNDTHKITVLIFQALEATFFAELGIDRAFDTEASETYVFSTKYRAYIDYAPGSSNDKILSVLPQLLRCFPFSKTQVFENGIDSHSGQPRGKEVYLFKGNKYTRIDYDSKRLIGKHS
ncbi:hypothetical protein ACSQ67_015943 [Phaseolus vulgaris]